MGEANDFFGKGRDFGIRGSGLLHKEHNVFKRRRANGLCDNSPDGDKWGILRSNSRCKCRCTTNPSRDFCLDRVDLILCHKFTWLGGLRTGPLLWTLYW